MILLSDIVAKLEARGIACAVIGGLALAARGVARATLDADVLVVERQVLDEGFWVEEPASILVEIRRGDSDDPLAGVVRCRRAAEVVDIVVGKHAWQKPILARRTMLTIGGRPLPLVEDADLVLLKLFAGGPQDLLDVRLLIAADPADLPQRVESRLAVLPAEIRRVWDELRRQPPL